MNAQQRLTDVKKAIDTKRGMSVEQFNITAVRANADIPDTDKL